MSEQRTIKGAWVVIGLITLGVVAGVAEVVVRHSRKGREPATAPGATTRPGGESTR
jgi:hypothetical protein